MFVFLDTTGSRGSGRGCSRGCRARLRARSARDFTRIEKVPAGFARPSRATPAGFAREGVDEVVREVVRASCGLRAGFARASRATPAGFALEGADEVVREVVHEFVAVFVLM